MTTFIEQLIARAWNHLVAGGKHPVNPGGLDLGFSIQDGQPTTSHCGLAQTKRMEHIAILGKTGTGKSTLLRYMARQDIERGPGFCFFDLHGDATPVLLRFVAAEERRTGSDLSGRLILVEPGDPEFSVGLNVLEQTDAQRSFVQIAEFAAILKQRWHLDSFGARTEELLRNTLQVLGDNNLTLLELARLLTDQAFRAVCVSRTRNSEVKDYFGARYDQASEGMRAAYRDAILNKVSTFTADPHFRHILGQRQSTFSLVEAMDRGHWILLNLDKGRLGEQASTLGSLFLTKVKNALFTRQRRSLFTLYCDEIQNLVTFDSGLDTLLSEARKFGISISTANQFLDQYPAAMRSAILSVGTHIFFQLSSADADKVASGLDGGKSMADVLKNLPQRHMVIKSGHHRPLRAVVPAIDKPRIDYADLRNRCRARWAKRRTDIEREIQGRTRIDPQRHNREVLHGWE
jgi:energy-coupling factor transporter ATP-binding protein EcfA2